MNKTRFNTIKISLLIFTLSIFSNHLIAQTTNGIFFQAVARDNFSNPAKDRKIYVQSSIIQTTPTGKKVLSREEALQKIISMYTQYPDNPEGYQLLYIGLLLLFFITIFVLLRRNR